MLDKFQINLMNPFFLRVRKACFEVLKNFKRNPDLQQWHQKTAHVSYKFSSSNNIAWCWVN
jgi:hypothetical protein